MILELNHVRVACCSQHHQLTLDVASRVHLAQHDLQRYLMLRYIDAFGHVHLAEGPLAQQPYQPVQAPTTTSPLSGNVETSSVGRAARPSSERDSSMTVSASAWVMVDRKMGLWITI